MIFNPFSDPIMFATGPAGVSTPRPARLETGAQQQERSSTPRAQVPWLARFPSFSELHGVADLIATVLGGALAAPQDDFRDELVEEVVADFTSPIVRGATVASDALVGCSHSTATGLSLLAAAARRRLARPFDEVVCYPEMGVSRIGSGIVMDEEEYVQSFCLGCSGWLIRALAEPVTVAHTAHVLVPSRCRRCHPNFRGLTAGDIVPLTFFFPSVLYDVWVAMGQLKRGHEKKNYHVGWTNAVEAYARDNGGWTPRLEALLHFMPAITRLQAFPSVALPRWVAGLPDGRLRDVLWIVTHRYLHDHASCASLWRRSDQGQTALAVEDGSPKVPPPAVTAATLRDADIDANGGIVPACAVVLGNSDGEAVGIVGLDLPQRLPSAGPPQLSADGRHEFTDADIAHRIAPILGTPCVYDPNDERNLVSVIRDRIGGPRAEARKNRYNPSADHKGEVRRILALLRTEWFTAERVLQWTLELGTLDQLFDPKLSEAKARDMITEIQAGYQLPDKVPLMIKREATSNPGKAPRGICDAGLQSFVSSAQVLKVIEHGLDHLDHVINIKHRPKAAVLDSITATCAGAKGLSLPLDSFRVVECDHSTYEWTQSLQFSSEQVGNAYHWRVDGFDEVELGVLAIERDIIRHVADLMPKAICELHQQMVERTLNGSTKVTFVPKVKLDHSQFKKANWRLVMYLRARLSGDGQTSWGNRFHNMVVMSVVSLRRGRDLWRRLVDMATGKRPATDADLPQTWVFEAATPGKAHRFYWRPWGEGDDFMAHTAGNPALAGKPDTCDLEDAALTQWSDIRRGLESFGFSPKLVVRRNGRAEFVGAHMLLKDGFTVAGAWVPDICRGIVTSAVGTSAALSGASPASCAQISLAFMARADMFRGRCDPMCAAYSGYAADWWDQACRGSRGSSETEELAREVQLSWHYAELTGLKYQSKVTVGRLRECFGPKETVALPGALQRDLAAASIEAPIAFDEWGVWCMARPCISDDPSDVISAFPRGIREKLS